MGFFGTIKNNWKKSEAAVIVQNLLEHQARMGIFDADPAKVANVLVEACWTHNPEMFDGRFGQRPHKLSIAAYTLASYARGLPEGHVHLSPIALSLGMILREVEKHGVLYPFSALDQKIIGVAAQTYGELAEEMAARFPHALQFG